MKKELVKPPFNILFNPALNSKHKSKNAIGRLVDNTHPIISRIYEMLRLSSKSIDDAHAEVLALDSSGLDSTEAEQEYRGRVHTAGLIYMALVGAETIFKINRQQKIKASVSRKISERQKTLILSAYDDMVRAGATYGAITSLANAYGVHRNTIAGLIRQHKKKGIAQ